MQEEFLVKCLQSAQTNFSIFHTSGTKIDVLKLFACDFLVNGRQFQQGDCMGPEGVCPENLRSCCNVMI